jgi:hypothetical protein
MLEQASQATANPFAQGRHVRMNSERECINVEVLDLRLFLASHCARPIRARAIRRTAMRWILAGRRPRWIPVLVLRTTAIKSGSLLMTATDAALSVDLIRESARAR